MTVTYYSLYFPVFKDLPLAAFSESGQSHFPDDMSIIIGGINTNELP